MNMKIVHSIVETAIYKKENGEKIEMTIGYEYGDRDRPWMSINSKLFISFKGFFQLTINVNDDKFEVTNYMGPFSRTYRLLKKEIAKQNSKKDLILMRKINSIIDISGTAFEKNVLEKK